MTVPALTEERPISRVEAQRSRLDAFMGALEKRNDTLATLLTDSGVDPAFFLAVARRALTKTPDLLGCTSESLMQAFINAATDGLPPDGRKGAITFFKMKDGTKAAQWNPMVQGLLDIAYRSNKFLNIDAQVVYEGEQFEYELGDNPFIRHKRNAASVALRKIVNAYAIAKTTNGGIFREVMEKPDLDKVRAVSRAQNGPNKDWPEEMARKAPLRRLWKYLPKTPAMERVVNHDDHTYDLTAINVPREAPKSLKPGFQPQLVQTQAEDITPTANELFDGEAPEFAIIDPPHDDGLPIRDETESEARDAPGEGDAPNLGALGLKTGTQLKADQEVEALMQWASELTVDLDAMTALQVDEISKDPAQVAKFAELAEAKPAIARALDETIAARRRELSR